MERDDTLVSTVVSTPDTERRSSIALSDDSDDDSDIGVTYPRMRTAFRVMGVSLILVVIGILFILVPFVLTPNPMATMQKYIITGIAFIGMGILVLVANLIWCKCREKNVSRRISTKSSSRAGPRTAVYTVCDRQDDLKPLQQPDNGKGEA